VPVHAVQQIEQGKRLISFIPNKIGEELEACPEIGRKERNKLKAFLQAQGILSITEMDYSLREKFEENLKYEQQLKQVSRYLLAYDRVKQYSIRQQMQTLSGTEVSGAGSLNAGNVGSLIINIQKKASP